MKCKDIPMLPTMLEQTARWKGGLDLEGSHSPSKGVMPAKAGATFPMELFSFFSDFFHHKIY